MNFKNLLCDFDLCNARDFNLYNMIFNYNRFHGCVRVHSSNPL